MIDLFIETATFSPFIALKKEKLDPVVIFLDQGPRLSEQFFLKLEELFQFEAVEWDMIGTISVSLGPGSYTGMRVGFVIAEMLAFSREIPLFGFSSLATLLPKNAPSSFISCLDARRGRVYFQKGQKGAAGWTFETPQVALLSELYEEGTEGFPLVFSEQDISFKSDHRSISTKVSLEGWIFLLEQEKIRNPQGFLGRLQLHYLQEPLLTNKGIKD